MNKQECIIIKDLLPNYIKNLTSVEVNEFIEKHISECHSCKEFLGELEREYQKQTLKDNILEQEEIDCLKKYRKKMRTLLLTLVSFIGGLLVIVFTVLGIKYKYNKYIITSVYDKLNEISNIENFKIGITDKHINFENNTEDTFSENIYYIDGKYREQHNEINTNREILNNYEYSYYGEVDSNKRTEVYEETKTIINSTTNYNYTSKEGILKVFDSSTPLSARENPLLVLSMNIRDERYEGKEYYVIKFQNSKNSYRELWIDKNSKLIERNINDIVGEFYSEKKIEYTPNIVKEDDVQVSAKGYTVKNKQAEVEKEIAEFMNNGL